MTLMCSICLLTITLLVDQMNSESLTNQWERTTGSNGEDIWVSTSDFIPVQAQSFGSIKIGREMSAEFDFIWYGRTNNPRTGNYYEMFFRVGFDASLGLGCDGQGARYPSFWISRPNIGDYMHVSVSNLEDCQPHHSLIDFGQIQIGISYHVKISFNDTALTVQAGLTSSNFPQYTQTWPRQGTQSKYWNQEVPVWWMSGKKNDIGYNRGNGTFSNVVLISKLFGPDPTGNPSIDPTMNPSMEPTIETSSKPTLEPTIKPTLELRIEPTDTPEMDGSVNENETESPTMSEEVAEVAVADNALEVNGIKIMKITVVIGCFLVGVVGIVGLLILCGKKSTNDKGVESKHHDDTKVDGNYTVVKPDDVEEGSMIHTNYGKFLSDAQKEVLLMTPRGLDAEDVVVANGHDEQYSDVDVNVDATEEHVDVDAAVEDVEDQIDLQTRYLSEAQKEILRSTPGGEGENDMNGMNETQPMIEMFDQSLHDDHHDTKLNEQPGSIISWIK